MKSVERNYLSPLLFWDLYSEYFFGLVKNAKANRDIQQLKSVIGYPMEDWVITTIKEEEYDALVVTDSLQNIQWVSSGFVEMTGYTKAYAIGKTPHFLQGSRTSKETKNAIRKGLKNDENITESVYNYKKNGDEYLCEIKIIPLFDKNSGMTHYLALEKELKAA